MDFMRPPYRYDEILRQGLLRLSPQPHTATLWHNNPDSELVGHLGIFNIDQMASITGVLSGLRDHVSITLIEGRPQYAVFQTDKDFFIIMDKEKMCINRTFQTDFFIR